MSEVTEEIFKNINDLENSLSETDIQQKELLKFHDAIVAGMDYVDHLLDISNNLPKDDDADANAALESVNNYVNKTIKYLGLEDNAMVATGEVIDHNKKENLATRIMNMIKRILNAIIAFFSRVIEVAKSQYNIIFMMMDKIFHNFDKSIDELDSSFVEKHKLLKVNNSKLARYFAITDGHLNILTAKHLCMQYKILDSVIVKIYDSLMDAIKDLQNKRISNDKTYVLSLDDIHHLLTKLKSLILVNGITLSIDMTGKITKNPFNEKLTDEFVINIDNKEAIKDLNKENKENAKNIISTFQKYNDSKLNYWISAKTFHLTEVSAINQYMKENPYASEESIAMEKAKLLRVKLGMLSTVQLLKYLFYLETETYRANVKFIGVVLTALHKAKEAK